MLHCIWHKNLSERVVATEEYHNLLATGDYFRSPWEAKKALEDNAHEKDDRSRHNLHSPSAKTCDDERKTNRIKRSKAIRSGDDKHGDACSGISKNVDKGARSTISGEVSGKDLPNDTSHENDQ